MASGEGLPAASSHTNPTPTMTTMSQPALRLRRRLRTSVLTLGSALVAALLLLGAAAPAHAQTGTIAGTVVDGATGETLIGVNVLVPELSTGAATGLDGDYRIPGLGAGTYTLRFSYLGYTTQTVTGVEVEAGETTTIDVALSEEAVDIGGEVIVEAAVLRDSEVGLLIERQNAAGVSDAISAESISRAGASTAADALQKVPGASVVGGKYLVVRGLSDRYLNTQLNGATLPSADPERNAAPLDLFPSGLLENIVTSKSFTPDQPGDFTGGSVNISTRTFPEELTAQLSTSVGFNTAVEPGSEYLRYSGGGVGLFGAPGSGLALPDAVEGLGPRDISEASQDQRRAITEAFGSTFAPQPEDVALNRSLSASVGNRGALLGRPLGFLVGANWSRSADGYASGVNSEFSGAGDNLTRDYLLNTLQGQEEVLFGGLANLNYRPTDRSELGLNLLYNRNATSTAILQTGLFEDGTLQEADNVYEGRSLFFTERTLLSSQLRGKHALSERGLRAEWNAAYSRTSLDEPDFRIFQNEVDRSNPADGDADFLIRTSAYDAPSRTFRNLEEDGLSGALSVEIPLGERAGLPVELKVGGAADYRDRAFRERTFLYPVGTTQQRLLDEFDGDPNVLIANAAEAGLFIDDQTDLDADYDGELQVYAGYAMLDLALVERLRFIGGLRYEYTDLRVASPRGTFRAEPDGVGGYTAGGLGEALLPAASLVYALSEEMNLRAAYGKTLARPTFREVAPRAVFSLAERYTINGNPNLRQSSIHNADLRWEWFTRPGEVLAASAFYKRFADPIELTIVAANNQLQPQNLGDADLLGVELEARRRLDFLPGLLGNLQAGGNLSLVRAEVELTDLERVARGLCSPAEAEAGACPADTRPLEGQSPFVANLDLGYLDLERGTSVSVFFNAFGRRLQAVSIGAVPDLYEEPRLTLDLTARQEVWGGIALKLSAKNILGERYRLVYYDEDAGEGFLRQEYDLGRSFSFGVSYSL